VATLLENQLLRWFQLHGIDYSVLEKASLDVGVSVAAGMVVVEDWC
jgi:hypothetical protein